MSTPAQEIARRRTFAIISHPDAGKTTLTEKFLLYGNAIHLAGAVTARKNQRATTSDWMELERQRGISISSTVLQFDYLGYAVNLLDTPGHKDFSEDTYRVLTAVDAALMVIDAAKGVEAQTLRLLEVCRARNTPIITFMNKMDREVRPPLELMDEIESILKLTATPFTWPIGMGKLFGGVADLRSNQMRVFKAGEDRRQDDVEIIEGLDNPLLKERFEDSFDQARSEMDLIRDASPEFIPEEFLSGRQTPMFFGSAVNNFGVREVLDALVDLAPPPGPRPALQREVQPVEPKFSGVVFKIQANMDPAHRDRIAFVRVCSGTYDPGMRMYHTRLGREVRVGDAITFMAADRQHVEEAYAGDIIGLHNHGTINIGDSFTQGEPLEFTGIPSFAPELFRRAVLRDPLKLKALQKGLAQLCEEGATQLFRPSIGNDMILGAVGPLQFEVAAYRLRDEYGVEAVFEAVAVVA